jgi:hypothetical protein
VIAAASVISNRIARPYQRQRCPRISAADLLRQSLLDIRRYYEARIWVFWAPYLKVWRSWTNLQLEASITTIPVNTIPAFAYLE